MTQIKIFYGSYIATVQDGVNAWLAENDKVIINVTIGPIFIYNGDKYITITYNTLEPVEFEKVETPHYILS
jgi:hypothetical protein